jgi:formylglycine-generating enzyme required for sulfatase activity
MSAYEMLYINKRQELHEMLKFSIYSESDIIEKIRNIQAFANLHQLDAQPLDETMYLAMARELQPFYDLLWEAQLVKDWKAGYGKLSSRTRRDYGLDEVRRDWNGRRYSKGKYDEMMAYLNGVGYWLDELKDRFKQYEMSQIYYADRKEYLLNWEAIIEKYEHKILKRKVHKIEDIEFNMIKCPKGEFWMGSKHGVGYYSEKPRHKVRMSQGMWMGETQVTQELWQVVMGWNPSHFKGSLKLPVESVTWYDCLVFCNKLSELEGFLPCFSLKNIEKDGNQIMKAIVEWNSNANGYRLPTEAEWEYCAKAGTELIYSGSNHLDEVAWYRDNSEHQTREVKTKKANVWGLSDMTGNVWEWCMDQWDSKAYKNRTNGNIENPLLWSNDPCAHIVRGGFYRRGASGCRVARRVRHRANFWSGSQGLRLLRCEP